MIRPGSKIHCQPSTMNSKIAVTKSTAHCTGGVSVKKIESPSASAARAKAKTSLLLEKRERGRGWDSSLCGIGVSGGRTSTGVIVPLQASLYYFGFPYFCHFHYGSVKWDRRRWIGVVSNWTYLATILALQEIMI